MKEKEEKKSYDIFNSKLILRVLLNEEIEQSVKGQLLLISPTSSLDKLFDEIQRRTQITAYRLNFDDKVLSRNSKNIGSKEEETLEDLGLRDYSTVTILKPIIHIIKLKNKLNLKFAKPYPLAISLDDTLDSIIHHMNQEHGISINELRLKGNTLKPGMDQGDQRETLNALGITNESVLFTEIAPKDETNPIEYTVAEDKPDILDLSDEEVPRALMPCGHAITPDSLRELCHSEVCDKKMMKITCPADQCSATWKWPLITQVANFTAEEKESLENEFAKNVSINSVEHVQCPKCKTIYKQENPKLIICYVCSDTIGKWFAVCSKCSETTYMTTEQCCSNPLCNNANDQTKLLWECDTIKIDKEECPKIRACPKCNLLIDHKGKCKHMTCPNCRHQFCFVCLKPWVKKHPCEMAPRQNLLQDN